MTFAKRLFRTLLPLAFLVLLAGARDETFRPGDPVAVEWKGKWWPAVVLDVHKGEWKVHYDGYDASWDEWVGPERIRAAAIVAKDPPARPRWKAGAPVQVEWKGKWYPALILQARDDQYRIHYVGWDSSWDEWVGLDRVRGPK